MNKLFQAVFTIELLFDVLICSGQNSIINTERIAPYGLVSFSLAPNVVLSGISNTKHIDGYVKSTGSSMFIFPVGDNGYYRPFAASAPETNGAYFFANPDVAVTSNREGGNYPALPAGAPFPTSSKASGIGNISQKEYWDINGSTATKITLTWNSNSDLNTLTDNNLSKLRILGWNGNNWVIIPALVDATGILGGSSTVATGSITTEAPIVPNEYNVYTLGAISAGPLPVTLATFTVSAEEKSARLNWATTSEVNNEEFQIEYSINAKDWTKIGTVKSKGNNIGLENYSFLHENPVFDENFYRLRILDRDDTFAYSQIRNLHLDLENILLVYPNPVSERIFIKGNNISQITNVSFFDYLGRSVYSQKSFPSGGLDISHLDTGMYIMKITGFNGLVNSFKIMIKH